MSDDGKRRRGGMSSYVNGGASKLVSAPRDFDDVGLVGGWSREQLVEMDARFCAAVERAIRRGLERPQ